MWWKIYNLMSLQMNDIFIVMMMLGTLVQHGRNWVETFIYIYTAQDAFIIKLSILSILGFKSSKYICICMTCDNA